MKKSTLIISCLLFFAYSTAQVRLTLEDCIGIALENNLELKNRLLDIERQRLIKSKTAWNSFPRINLGGSHEYEYGLTIEPNSNRRTNENFISDDLYLRASIDILNISKFKEHNKSKVDLKRIETDREVAKNQMLLAISQYYLEVMFHQEYVEILRNQLKESEKQLERLNEALGFGYIAKSELYDAEAEFSIDRKAVLLGENNRKRAVLNLLNLINYDREIDNVEFFDIVFKVDTSEITNKTEFYDEALKNNPEITSSDYNVKSAKKDIGINRANGLPSLKLEYQYNTFYTKSLTDSSFEPLPFEDQLNNNKAQYVGASVNIPLFNALQNQHNIKISKVDFEKAKVEQEIVKNSLKFAIGQTFQDLENAISAYQTSVEVLNAARESFRTSRLKYEQGKINAFDFATAKKNLLQTEFDLLDSKFKLYYNRTKLNVLSNNTFKP